MARVHGRNGHLYMDITGSGTPQPIFFLKTWKASMKADREDVTAFGDSNKTYLQGFSDFAGSYDGFLDDSTQQMYTAATDGTARKFYLYEKSGAYFYGSSFFDFEVDVDVKGPEKVSGTFAASGAVTRV